MTLKSLSTTQWCACEDTISENKKGNVRCEAEGLLRKLCTIEVAFMTSVWGCILQQFGKAIKKLQANDVDISIAVEMCDSLTMFLTEFQTSFPIYKDSTKNKLVQIRNSEVLSSYAVEIQRQKCQIKRKRSFDELAESEEEPENITELKGLQIYDAALKLRAIYNSDLVGNFGEECIHFKSYLLSMKKENGSKLSSLPFSAGCWLQRKLVMSN
ncbi:hypothetical protein PR048_001114 [Dryococelus australis]|uniref:Uncharacterized protein n=1 Tax=Dryococelus australis TaxID=614101 RepID=A0ABQ9IHF7_9NEOP|nr:hypothetical protein PR048_001114 [Dryococelus australis]